MEVKKYDKIILDSTRSIDDIVAGIKAELSKQESENAGESYICYVSHAYSSGQNAGVNYIVVSDDFKNLNGLSSNVIKASAYTKDEINELIARVEAKITVAEANLATKEEVNELIARVEAKIPVDEANLATKEEVNEINSTLTDAINTINTKANADAVVNLTGEQTIEGVKTFSMVPVVASQPTEDTQVANKAYVDSKSSEITRLTDAINSNIANIQSSINQVISSDVTPIGVYKNVENKTVGANGDFKTIQEAFIYVQTRQKQGIAQQLTLTLLEDLNNPSLYFRGAWYPYLTIDCNGFILANKLGIELSCFIIQNLKLNGRMTAVSSLLWLSDNINIQYTSSDYAGGCITADTNTLIVVNCKNCNFSAPSNRSAFSSYANSMIFVKGGSITQSSGSHCFAVSNGGIIQTHDGLNLNGVTVPKANIAANTITRKGIIFGNYTL